MKISIPVVEQHQPPKPLVWQPLCLTCFGSAEMLYKGSSYCKPCYLEFRRTHNE